MTFSGFACVRAYLGLNFPQMERDLSWKELPGLKPFTRTRRVMSKEVVVLVQSVVQARPEEKDDEGRCQCIHA